MPGLSKVIVLDPDARAGRQVQLGFEREGVPAAALPADAAGLGLPGHEPGLVVVGGVDGRALELVRGTRKWLDDQHLDAPIVFAGRGVMRSDAEAAGADEVVLRPAYLRDVVTIGRLLRGVPAAQRSHLVGNLIEVTGVFTLVRALAALGRSATLTLVRGLRRGEIRFYHGEVTSAQVGMIHGQAALHQLLLWTDARFDYHHEDIVRRHQIPLSHHELFADAERFLEGVRDSSGALSPSMVLEQDLQRVQSFGKQIPTEVYGVLRMFDGYRVLADVLEDSPYRVFETLRVAQRAVEVGLLRIVDKQQARTTWRAILAIEEWLVGGEARGSAGDSGPVASDAGQAKQHSGPTTQDSGPIARGTKAARKPRRKKKRRADTPPAIPIGSPGPSEIDWGALVPRVVGAEVGPLSGVVPASHVSGEIVASTPAVTRETHDPQPKVVFDEAAELAHDANARAAAEAEARARAAAERADAERLAADALAQAAAEARANAEAALAEAEARAQEAAAQADAARRAAEAVAQADAERRAAETAAQADAERRAAEAAAQADAERRAAETAAQAEAERRAAEAAAADADAEARAGAIRVVAATVSLSSEPSHVVDDLLLDDTKPERLFARGKLTEPTSVSVMETAGVTVVESPTASIVVHDSVIVEASGETTARLTATPITRAIEAAAAAAEPAPSTIIDEPSDGVIRQHITTADTAPVKRRRLPSDPPEDDRPEDAMGEITAPRARVTAEPRHSEPSILVADLAAIHAAVSEVADDQITTPITPNAASPSREATVASARNDAVAFNEVEEAFFRAGHERDAVVVPPPIVESFDDLDEGYQPVKFWDRLRGKPSPAKPTKPDSPAPPPGDPEKK
jgi:hypothetical protein